MSRTSADFGQSKSSFSKRRGTMQSNSGSMTNELDRMYQQSKQGRSPSRGSNDLRQNAGWKTLQTNVMGNERFSSAKRSVNAQQVVNSFGDSKNPYLKMRTPNGGSNKQFFNQQNAGQTPSPFERSRQNSQDQGMTASGSNKKVAQNYNPYRRQKSLERKMGYNPKSNSKSPRAQYYQASQEMDQNQYGNRPDPDVGKSNIKASNFLSSQDNLEIIKETTQEISQDNIKFQTSAQKAGNQQSGSPDRNNRSFTPEEHDVVDDLHNERRTQNLEMAFDDSQDGDPYQRAQNSKRQLGLGPSTQSYLDSNRTEKLDKVHSLNFTSKPPIIKSKNPGLNGLKAGTFVNELNGSKEYSQKGDKKSQRSSRGYLRVRSNSSVFNKSLNKTTSRALEDPSESFDYFYKIIIIGDENVGKTNFLHRVVYRKFEKKPKATYGVEFEFKTIPLPASNQRVRAQLWDTSGAKQFLSITTTHYRFAVGAILVYDITNKQSFENLNEWLQKIREYSDRDVKIALVGNKRDLVEAVRDSQKMFSKVIMDTEENEEDDKKEPQRKPFKIEAIQYEGGDDDKPQKSPAFTPSRYQSSQAQQQQQNNFVNNWNQRAQGRLSNMRNQRSPTRPGVNGLVSPSSKRKSVAKLGGRPSNSYGNQGNFKSPAATNQQMFDINQPTFPTPQPNSTAVVQGMGMTNLNPLDPSYKKKKTESNDFIKDDGFGQSLDDLIGEPKSVPKHKRMVTEEEGRKFAVKNRLTWLGETSMLEDSMNNCNAIFSALIQDIHKTQTDLVRSGYKNLDDIRFGEEERNIKYNRCCY